MLENKYSRWYEQIIDRARQRQHAEGMERHHIMPKSLGGSNARTNLVSLTYREHFVAHWLLTKFAKGDARRLMYSALACMVCSRNGQRYLTSRQFEVARRARAEAMRGVPSPLKGRPKSPETRARMRAAWSKGRGPEYFEKLSYAARNRSTETREKLRIAASNLSPETRAKRSAANKARKGTATAETRAKISAATIGNKRCVGRVLSEETKAKIGAASKLTQARLRKEREAAR